MDPKELTTNSIIVSHRRLVRVALTLVVAGGLLLGSLAGTADARRPVAKVTPAVKAHGSNVCSKRKVKRHVARHVKRNTKRHVRRHAKRHIRRHVRRHAKRHTRRHAKHSAKRHAPCARSARYRPARHTATRSIPVTSAPTPPAVSPVAITGTTYYVSISGLDSNAGTSPSSAWRTVGRVNDASLRPGDGVLFQAGQRFSDEVLMPNVSGSSGAPIVYGSYGSGKALLPRGIWFRGVSSLAFQDLAISGTSQGVSASPSGAASNDVTIQNMTIDHVGLGINSGNPADSGWKIQNNTIDQTGDSGMLLLGDRFTVTGNTITNTGTDSSISYGKHGIYLKSSNSTASYNTIRSFSDDGISVRYRNSVVEHNTISNGPIGLAWFQYDASSGTAYWRYNAISNTTAADIYVSPSDAGGNTREHFVIAGNALSRVGGAYMNLKPTSGSYSVAFNALQ